MDSGQLSSVSVPRDSTLVFKDVCVAINKKDILKDICGIAKAAQTLAIMGPSGAGKSTLLNALTGRIHTKSGSITLDGHTVNRHIRRKMSYVMQQDVFYPNLTLRETLTVAYFGPSNNIINFFSNLGLHCEPNYNPADFILEKVKSGPEVHQRIIEGALALRKDEDWPIELRDENELEQVAIVVSSDKYDDGEVKLVQNGFHKLSSGNTNDANNGVILTKILRGNTDCEPREVTSYQEVEGDSYIDENATWQTGFFTQLSTLTKRDFVRSKEQLLSKLNFFQILIMSIFAGLVWFQITRAENTAKDRLGVLFVTAILFGFLPLIDGIMIMGDDAGVFHRERSSGLYRLSAYYLAIQTTAIPVAAIGLPSLWVVIVYWMSGLMPAAMNFISYWLITLLNVFAAQSIGMLIAVVVTNRAYVMSFAQTLMMASLLAGGYYSTHIAFWFEWIRYLSFITYTLEALAIIEFQLGAPLLCNPPDTTLFPAYCSSTNTSSAVLPGVEILKSQNLNFAPVYCCVLVLFGISVIARIIAYFVLRFLRRPKT